MATLGPNKKQMRFAALLSCLLFSCTPKVFLLAKSLEPKAPVISPAAPSGQGAVRTPAPVSSPLPGGAQALSLELDSLDSLGVGGRNLGEGALVGAHATSGIVPLPVLGLEAGALRSSPLVGCVVGLGGAGALIQARDRTSWRMFFEGGTTDLAWVQSDDGRLLPLIPNGSYSGLALDSECAVALQPAADGAIYALEKGGLSLWRFSLSTRVGERILTPPQGHLITRFVPLEGEHVLFSTIDAGYKRFSWWRNATGDVTELGYPNVDLSRARSLGARALTFSSHPRGGASLVIPSGNRLLRTFLEPLYGDSTSTLWDETRHQMSGWLLDGYMALNLSTGGAASHPYRKTYGRSQGLVDPAAQLYFDGSSIVKMNYAAQVLKVTHHRHILQDTLSRWKVFAVFGPAQGFTERWAGLASEEGFLPAGESPKQYWVEIDPETGRVDDAKIYRIKASNMPSSWGSESVIPEFTAYRVLSSTGKPRLVGLGGVAGAGVFRLIFDEADKTVTLGPALGCTTTSEHDRALVHDGRLWFTASQYLWGGVSCPMSPDGRKFVYYFDAEAVSDSEPAGSTAALGQVPLPTAVHDTILAPPPGGRDNCNGRFFYGLVVNPVDAKPALLLCDVKHQDPATDLALRDAPLKLIWFEDFSFADISSEITLPLRVGVGSHASGDFASGTSNPTNEMRIYSLSEQRVALGIGRGEKVRVVDTSDGSTETEVRFPELWTENRFEYSSTLEHVANLGRLANPVDLVAPWDGTRFLVSDETPGGQRSFLVSFTTRALAPIGALDGLRVLSVTKRRREGAHLVSVWDGAKALTLALDENGNETRRSDDTLLMRVAVPLSHP